MSEPQYTEQELEEFRTQNEEGITYQGRHYTMYEATQIQRRLERSMRTTKRKILIDEEIKDDEHLLYDQIRLRRINEEYTRFSRAADLPLQRERMRALDFDRSKTIAANLTADEYYEYWSKSRGINSTLKTLDNYYDFKYNNPPAYKALKQYVKDVDAGWISPLISFKEYLALYDRVNTEIVGKTVANGITIKGQNAHFLQRVIGTMIDPKEKKLRVIRRSGVNYEDIKDTLFDPIEVSDVVIKENGKPSVLFYGEKCNVSVNPETCELIQTNPVKGEK